MKKDLYFKSIFTFLITLLCHVGFGQEQIITINLNSAGGSSNLGTTNYGSGIEKTWSQNNINFGGKSITAADPNTSNNNTIQTQASNGILYNISEIPGKIKKIKITQKTAVQTTLYVGNTSRIVNSVSANTTINNGTSKGALSLISSEWDLSSDTNQYTYFALKRGGSAAYWSSIEITYEAESDDKIPQTIIPDFTDLIKNIGDDPLQLNPLVTEQGLGLEFTSSDETIVSIINNELHFVGLGEAIITASNDGDETYASFEKTFNVQVNDPNVNVCIDENFDSNSYPSGWSGTGVNFNEVEGLASINTNNGVLITPLLNRPIVLEFDLSRTNNSTAKTLYIEGAVNSDFTIPILLQTFTHGNTTNNGLTSVSLVLNNQNIKYIRFRKESSTTSPWRIDNVKIICGGQTTILPTAPEARPASKVSAFNFQTNWKEVSGNNYLLDVYSKVIGNYTSDLIITEYVEGTSQNKALEIYNGTGNPVNLDEYKIKKQSNGEGPYIVTYNFPINKVLNHGEAFVLVHASTSNISPDLVALADDRNEDILGFNGNDAIVLLKNDVIIDQVGIEGDTNNWGENVTLRRKPSANPNPIYHPTEWDQYPQNTFDGLGQHSTNIVNGIKKSYIVRNEEVPVNTTSYVVDTNVDKFTDYYYVVRSKLDNKVSVYSDEMDVKRTYFENNSWSIDRQPDDEFHSVVIQGVYNDLLFGKSITIDNGIANTITGGNTYFPKHSFDVLSGTITFKENAYLLQEDDESINFGNATFERKAKFFRYDSKFWSSPVADQNISTFMLDLSTVYNYHTLNRNWVNISSDDNFMDAKFLAAKGYAIQAGANYPFFDPENEDYDGVGFDGLFTGKPQNGEYRISVSTEGSGDNGVGNPYGSPISASAFLNENVHVTRLYFWNEEAHYDPTVTPVGYNTQTWSALNQSGHNDGPTKFIGVGVGFIARVDRNDDIVFNNSMRTSVTNVDDIYNRTSTEKDRFWLSLNSDNKKENQILIGYVEGATNGIDEKYDAKNLSNNNSFILSHSNANAMIIEGRQYPLDINDQIPLYFRASELGDYTIKLENKEGIFNSQPIYLIDNELNLSINLNEETEYTFNSEIGNFTDRFEIRYQPKETLSTIDLDGTTDLIVYKNDNLNKVTSKENVIGYKVYDISGRLISNEKVNQLKDFTLTTQDKGTYIVKFTLENGRVISKKVIF